MLLEICTLLAITHYSLVTTQHNILSFINFDIIGSTTYVKNVTNCTTILILSMITMLI